MALSYRAVIEVLKWVQPQQTLSAAAQVNKCFQTVSDSDELWFSYIDLEELGFQHLHQSPLKVKEGVKFLHQLRMKQIVFLATDLCVFNCQSKAVTKRLPTHPLLDKYSAVTFISCSELFVCGGRLAEEDASLLNTETATVKKLPSMHRPRTGHAIVVRRGQVYVFGSIQHPSNTAEKYGICAQEWSQLPSMTSDHSCFTACSQSHLIYLCGGFTLICETFDIDTEEFHPLPFRLPEVEASNTFVYDNEVICITKGKCYCVNTQGKTTEVRDIPNLM